MFKSITTAYGLGLASGLKGNKRDTCPYDRFIYRFVWDEGWFSGMNSRLRTWLNARAK